MTNHFGSTLVLLSKFHLKFSKGLAGDNGMLLAPGEKGLPGDLGNKGQPGEPGASGLNGPDGRIGDNGLPGSKGIFFQQY